MSEIVARSNASLRCLEYELEERFVRLRRAAMAREDNLRRELGRANARVAAAERRAALQSSQFATERAAFAGDAVQRRMRAAMLAKMMPSVRAELVETIRDEVRDELWAEANAATRRSGSENRRRGGGNTRSSQRHETLAPRAAQQQRGRRHARQQLSAQQKKARQQLSAQQKKEVERTALPRPQQHASSVSWRSPLCEIRSSSVAR